ncbi:ABC transporter ATP-binding protein [Cupriavidus nantongensis]|uniref:ABC transporter ATP-binding protein n=1 Tax=Cupriavidus nantongensis TaxID=1796606 RepID=UPI00358EB805
MNAILQVRALSSRYGDLQALHGVDMDVYPGEIVSVIGTNGAGKSTLLKSIVGLLPVQADAVRFGDAAIGGIGAAATARAGISLVPEGRRLFPSLSVQENLLMGKHTGRTGPWDLQRVYALFPALKDKRTVPATSLSGGQQQMVAIGRALMGNPRLLLCDEISLGLAPAVVREVYAALAAVGQDGTTVVVVEQDLSTACRVSERLYCLQRGRVTLSGRADALSAAEITQAYFGC